MQKECSYVSLTVRLRMLLLTHADLFLEHFNRLMDLDARRQKALTVVFYVCILTEEIKGVISQAKSVTSFHIWDPLVMIGSISL